MAADRTPDRPAVEDPCRDGRIAVRRGVLDQGLGDRRVADRAVEFLGLEQGAEAGPVVDGEQAAAGQPGDDIVPQVGLLQLGQQDDPALAPSRRPAAPHEPGTPCRPGRPGPCRSRTPLRPGPTQAVATCRPTARASSSRCHLSSTSDRSCCELRAADAHCGPSSSVHWIVSR